jgi:hypothetical protein
MVKEAFDFSTELRPIQVAGGRRIPNRKAVIRTDTGTVLGIVGDNYEIVPHAQVVNTFDKVSFLRRQKVDVCRDGAILFAQYEFLDGKNVKSAEVKVGDTINFGLRAFNSYNSVFGVGFELNALRLVCKNGLVIPRTIARLSFRHFQNVDVSKFNELIFAKSDEITKTIDTWKIWRDIHPDEGRVKAFFEEIKLGKRLTDELLPKAMNDISENGLWGCFNTITAYITHDMKTRGDESNRMLAVRNKERELLYKFYSHRWN